MHVKNDISLAFALSGRSRCKQKKIIVFFLITQTAVYKCTEHNNIKNKQSLCCACVNVSYPTVSTLLADKMAFLCRSLYSSFAAQK